MEYTAQGTHSPHANQQAKGKMGSGWGPNIPVLTQPRGPNFLPLGPTSSTFHHLPIAPQNEEQLFSTWPLGDIQYLDYNTLITSTLSFASSNCPILDIV